MVYVSFEIEFRLTRISQALTEDNSQALVLTNGYSQFLQNMQ